MPERLGFTLEVRLRERDVVRSGELRDQVVYSLLRTEWESATER